MVIQVLLSVREVIFYMLHTLENVWEITELLVGDLVFWEPAFSFNILEINDS